MRKLILATSLCLVAALAAQAQTKTWETKKISVPNALCEACKKRITEHLKRHDGVGQVTVNTRRGEVTVKYVTDRTNIENIKAAIANIGYDADDIKANEDFYKMLPKTCRKPEDGGHPKPKVPAGEN